MSKQLYYSYVTSILEHWYILILSLWFLFFRFLYDYGLSGAWSSIQRGKIQTQSSCNSLNFSHIAYGAVKSYLVLEWMLVKIVTGFWLDEVALKKVHYVGLNLIHHEKDSTFSH